MKSISYFSPFILSIMMVSTPIILTGCSGHSANSDKEDNIVTLQTNFDADPPSYTDYFESIETIPLETNDSSLIATASKILVVDDMIVVLDFRSSTVKEFHTDGSYIGQIGNKGQGPEDYLTVYDISYNKDKKYLSLLSPYGVIVNYTLDNKFVDRVELPSKPNYWAAEWIDGKRMVTWSAVESDEPGVSLIDPYSGTEIMSDWYNCLEFDLLSMNPFGTYDGKSYFAGPLTNDVYEITPDSLKLSYIWDFGKDNISENYRESLRNIDDRQTRHDKVREDLGKDNHKYDFKNNWQTNKYFLALMLVSPSPHIGYKTAVYSKENKTGVCFSKFKEGMTFIPVYVNDEYVLCQIPETEFDTYNGITASKLVYNDDDNIVLAKYYFKK